MGIGIIVIGDEILTGKRQDKHLPRVIGHLGQRNLQLHWCRYVGDDPDLLTRTLMETMASGDIVFSFGGIGATPDDVTRQCAASADGVDLVRHPGAVAELEAVFGAEAYPNRIIMAELPANAELIPNPVNRIPGFSVGDHHFLPGFPRMAWPMMDWVLDTRYPQLQGSAPTVEQAIWLLDTPESSLVTTMRAVAEVHPDAKIYSLPHLAASGARHIELGFRGGQQAVETAMRDLCRRLENDGIGWQTGAPADDG